jgi:DNA-directed RNA polymerase subunit E'/Rpb7
MSEELINPFVIKKLTTKIELYPHQMNADLYLNLKKNLKNTLEGKCNKYGFVNKIIRIEDYSDNIINPENFSGNAVYNIIYIANICIPLVKTIIIVKVENFNKHLILGKNGPINAIIKVSDINTNIFNTRPNGSIWIESLNKPLEKGDYLKVMIDGKKFSTGDDKIGVIGTVLGIANDAEIKDFYSSEVLEVSDESNYDRIQIEFNEDNDYLENLEQNKSNIEIKTNVSEI